MFSRRVTSAMSRDRFLYSAISPTQFYCKYSGRDIKSYVICCLVSDYYDYVSSRHMSFLEFILYPFLYVVNRPIFVLREIVDLRTCCLLWPSLSTSLVNLPYSTVSVFLYARFLTCLVFSLVAYFLLYWIVLLRILPLVFVCLRVSPRVSRVGFPRVVILALHTSRVRVI